MTLDLVILFGVGLMGFAAWRWLWVSLSALLLVGLSQQIAQTSNTTLIQVSVAPEFRGRVRSTLVLHRGVAPLGTMLAGFSGGIAGVPLPVGVM